MTINRVARAREIAQLATDGRWRDIVASVLALVDAVGLEEYQRGRDDEHLNPNLPRDYYGGGAMPQSDGHP